MSPRITNLVVFVVMVVNLVRPQMTPMYTDLYEIIIRVLCVRYVIVVN